MVIQKVEPVMTVPRIRSYVYNLDEQMEGGIPKGFVVLVCGRPGSMKSSLTYFMMHMQALKEGRRGVYFTLEQNRASFARHLSHIGLDPDALKRLELGALFHDIGKIGTPAHILSKPGPLTNEERDVIEQHPELGARILSPIAQLEAVRPIVRHCHERWDGGGYPDGKAAEEIPIESRIIFSSASSVRMIVWFVIASRYWRTSTNSGSGM